jgi:ATP-dependent DNA helicase RecG
MQNQRARQLLQMEESAHLEFKSDSAKAIALNIASGLNNPDLIDPPYLLEPSVEASNPCIPRTHGLLTSQTVVPFQKNPHLSRFFLQLGWVEEVGSGMANVEKWLPLYNAKGRVEFLEDDTFTTRVWLPVEEAGTPQATPQATEQAERQNRILEYCVVARSREEMMAFLGLSHREHFRSVILQPLLEQGLLAPTIPDKPNSPKQRYVRASGGKR